MIRAYGRRDLDTIMGIWLDGNTKAHDFISPAYWARNLALVRNRYIPESDTFVCEKDDEILGFISVMDNSYIGALFVAGDAQGSGVGHGLMEFVQERCERLTLKVYAKNERAVSFYQSCGFEIDETQTDPDTQEEEHVMSWESDSLLEYLTCMMC